MKLLDSWSFMISKLKKKTCVCDADFFWFLCQDLVQNLTLMKNGQSWIFTPNKREFTNIMTKLNNSDFDFGQIDRFFQFIDLAISKGDLEISQEIGVDPKVLKFENLEGLQNRKRSASKIEEKSLQSFGKWVEYQFTEKVRDIGQGVSLMANLQDNLRIYSIHDVGRVFPYI